MQKITRKKLALPRETVRRLSNTSLMEIVGGNAPPFSGPFGTGCTAGHTTCPQCPIPITAIC